jgi:hypothetical protein
VAQISLMCPNADELSDAQDALGQILDLDECGEVDLPPYLTRLLLQLQEILLATKPVVHEFAVDWQHPARTHA